jgi:hypothetical protein
MRITALHGANNMNVLWSTKSACNFKATGLRLGEDHWPLSNNALFRAVTKG